MQKDHSYAINLLDRFNVLDRLDEVWAKSLSTPIKFGFGVWAIRV